MPDVRLIDANGLLRVIDEEIEYGAEYAATNYQLINKGLKIARKDIKCAPTVDAQPVKHGHWSECYRDCRCISVICSVCKNPTVIAHGCRDADEVTMDDVIERLPHCPKCCSDMRGDADD